MTDHQKFEVHCADRARRIVAAPAESRPPTPMARRQAVDGLLEQDPIPRRPLAGHIYVRGLVGATSPASTRAAPPLGAADRA